MNTSSSFKSCLICGIVVSVIMSTGGRYVCKECGHEVHDDEPVKSQSSPIIDRVFYTASPTGSASIGSVSPSMGPDGSV